MKKILITALLLLAVVLAYFTLVNGIHIGKFEVLGIQALKEENEKIDKSIDQASKLTSASYPQKVTELNKSTKDLLSAKEEYIDRTTYSTEGEIEKANEAETYEIEHLYTKIGTYAKKQGVKIDMKITTAMDAAQDTTGRKLYDINFTVTGRYIQTSFFMSDLENESTLEFKIENFKMVSGTDGNLVSTYTVKNIPINIGNYTTATSSDNTNTNTTNTNTNTTNTTGAQTNTTGAQTNTTGTQTNTTR